MMLIKGQATIFSGQKVQKLGQMLQKLRQKAAGSGHKKKAVYFFYFSGEKIITML